MKVAIIARSTLFRVPGGDTVQAVQTARHLANIGIDVDVLLCNEQITYKQYDLLHFFNLIRPADILHHSKKANKPYVISTILCNYGEYDKHHRKTGNFLLSRLPADSIEYLKTMARWLRGRDHLSSLAYLWKGQRGSILDVLKRAAMILPNSQSEYRRVEQTYPTNSKCRIIPNGVDPDVFVYDPSVKKDEKLVLCVARIEGIKNQLNLIKALNGTDYKLLLIGAHAPNQADYYTECRRISANNISFIDHIAQAELVKYYQRAKVHILPSWFETTGLSSIEAAIMGCSIIITDRGDAKEYFGNDAFYCDPGDPGSIFDTVKKACEAPFNNHLYRKIHKQYTWQAAANQTLKAYQSVLT
jgi:glycosyltransferase involved in cell wall biosynthesis